MPWHQGRRIVYLEAYNAPDLNRLTGTNATTCPSLYLFVYTTCIELSAGRKGCAETRHPKENLLGAPANKDYHTLTIRLIAKKPFKWELVERSGHYRYKLT